MNGLIRASLKNPIAVTVMSLAIVLLGGLALERGGALVAALHDPALALRHCDRVVGLEEGRVVLDAPTASLTVAALEGFYGVSR